MGGNRRYDLISASVDRMVQEFDRRPEPIQLTDEQVRGSGRRKDAEEPLPVRAWVPHQVAYVEQVMVEGVAVAWTRDAVLVRWEHEGRERHTWVWASAVERG